jgi:hypothetical protein
VNKRLLLGSAVVVGVVVWRVALAGADKVAVCHVPESGTPHTIWIADAAVGAHLGHGDTEGECGVTEGDCPCYEPTLWQLYPFGGLYCTAPVSGGRLSVCTADGVPTCEAFAGDGSLLPLEDCAACLPASVGGVTFTECSQVPGQLP